MHLWHDISPGKKSPRQVRAIIEIPGGSKNKYELDKETGVLKLSRVLFSAVHYPADYGFIPRTLAEDGDPLDIVVLLTEPSFPGCAMEVRPLGVLGMRDAGARDEKILAVLLEDPLEQEYRKLKDVPGYLRREIEQLSQAARSHRLEAPRGCPCCDPPRHSPLRREVAGFLVCPSYRAKLGAAARDPWLQSP